jgi:hypothetical protein
MNDVNNTPSQLVGGVRFVTDSLTNSNGRSVFRTPPNHPSRQAQTVSRNSLAYNRPVQKQAGAQTFTL